MTRDEVLEIVLDHNNSMKRKRERLMIEYGTKYKEEVARMEMDEFLNEQDRTHRPVTTKIWDRK